MGRGDTLVNAVIGAAVTVVLSFTGFSPVLGGAVAGYLQREGRRRGARVGALSGAIATLPSLLFIGLAFALFVPVWAGPMPGMGPGMGGFDVPGGVGLVVILLIVVPLLFAWHVGLSAAGGYLGGYVREETAASDERIAAR